MAKAVLGWVPALGVRIVEIFQLGGQPQQPAPAVGALEGLVALRPQVLEFFSQLVLGQVGIELLSDHCGLG
jgi:hypothetical protein